MLDFSRLTAPHNHGEILIEPAYGLWPALIETNRKRIDGYSFEIAGVPFQELRRSTRQQLAAANRGPLLVLGHQPEFMHAGVWAKYVAASRFAHQHDGLAINLVADSDAPRQHELRFPEADGERLKIGRVVHHENRAGVAYECLPALKPAEIDQFAQKLRRRLGPRFTSSMLPRYLRDLRATLSPDDWVSQQVHARRQLEQLLGVLVTDHRVSRVWGGPLLAQILGDARRFADAYNQSLADYRHKMGIRGNRHPMPDLELVGNRIELPLWAYDSSGNRQRVFVTLCSDRMDLSAGSKTIASLAQESIKRWETAQGALKGCIEYCLRPRALMLTLWARLLLADLFIHGIGGAKYDRITDIFIRRYFGCEPPEMVCVTATLLLDDEAEPPDEARREMLTHMLRDIRYNAERYLPNDGKVDLLAAAKKKLIDASVGMRGQSGTHAERRRCFHEIQDINQQLELLGDDFRARWRSEVEGLEQRSAWWSVARHREYFFGLFSEAVLREFVSRFP